MHALFATPLGVDVFGNARLWSTVASRVVAEARGGTSVARSVVNGWHGPPDLALRDDEPWRTVTRGLMARVRAIVDEVTDARGATPVADLELHAQGWGTVLRRGGYSMPHDHQPAHWSLVWYPDPGDAPPAGNPKAGALAFLDPRGAVGGDGVVEPPSRLATLTPRRGTLAVFPGWLTHFVHPYAGRRPRVSLSYNVVLRARP